MPPGMRKRLDEVFALQEGADRDGDELVLAAHHRFALQRWV